MFLGCFFEGGGGCGSVGGKLHLDPKHYSTAVEANLVRLFRVRFNVSSLHARRLYAYEPSTPWTLDPATPKPYEALNPVKP